MNTNLVFICGFPSSGTDLLKNVLNGHPDIFIGGEFPFLPAQSSKYGPVVGGSAVNEVIANLKNMDVYHNFRNADMTISPIRQEYSLAEIYSQMLCNDERKWKGNKTPQNTENIDKLKTLFPRAKFVVIIRDVRDVALSWKNKWGKDQLLCASKWDRRMRRGNELVKKFRRDCLIVKYESLLDDFKNTACEICSFLEIEFHNDMLEFDQHVSEIVDGKLNYGRPILTDNHGKWRKEMGPSTVRRIEEIARESLRLFGYPLDENRQYRPITGLEKWSGLVRDISALVFVGNRAKKENGLLHRLGTVFYELRKFLLYRYSIR